MLNKQSCSQDGHNNNQPSEQGAQKDKLNRLHALTQKFRAELDRAIEETDGTIRDLETQSSNSWGRIGWN